MCVIFKHMVLLVAKHVGGVIPPGVVMPNLPRYYSARYVTFKLQVWQPF